MDKSEKNAIWHESIEKFSKQNQSIVCMEECAELIQAVSKAVARQARPGG